MKRQTLATVVAQQLVRPRVGAQENQPAPAPRARHMPKKGLQEEAFHPTHNTVTAALLVVVAEDGAPGRMDITALARGAP